MEILIITILILILIPPLTEHIKYSIKYWDKIDCK